MRARMTFLSCLPVDTFVAFFLRHFGIKPAVEASDRKPTSRRTRRRY